MIKIRDWLYIGDINDLYTIQEQNDTLAINSLLNLVEDINHKIKDYLFIDIDDGVPLTSNHVFLGSEFIINQYHHNKKILIACGAGVSRSATFCTIALKEIENLSLIDAYKELKKVYSRALPHPALWKSVCELYDEEFNYHHLLNN